jgi:TonB family protein
MTLGMDTDAQLAQHFAGMWPHLDEHTRRLVAASQVKRWNAQSNLLHSVAPKYPQAARDKQIEGAVVLEVHIDAEGRVSDAKVVGGPEELRSAALEAILQWHYSPQAMTLPATTQVTMDFKLPKDGAPAEPQFGDVLPEGKRVTLGSISVEGLTPSARDELLQRLPVHQGDALDASGMRAVLAGVRAFDEHLRVILNLSGDGSGVLRIHLAAGGSGAAPTEIRVGSNVQQAKLLAKVQPVYPTEAKVQGIEGAVVLRAIIDESGKVGHLQVLSGDPLLAAAAVDAVRQWQYQTTLLNGDPAAVVTEIRVNFTLAK